MCTCRVVLSANSSACDHVGHSVVRSDQCHHVGKFQHVHIGVYVVWIPVVCSQLVLINAVIFISDHTLTTDNVAQVMAVVNDWDSLEWGDIIPESRLAAILGRCSSKEEIATECTSYYVHCHPECSWTHLASHLYREGEFAAVEKLKPFLPLRGEHQVISYAGVNHALQACTVRFFCRLHNMYIVPV